MLTTNELKGYAHMRRLRLVDQIWKDYLQDLALHILFRRWPGLLFRGGTCIWKIYHGDRFSEDLDLCAASLPEGHADHMVRELGFLGFGSVVNRKKGTVNMVFSRLEIKSPTHPRPIMLQVEVLGSPECARKGRQATIYSPYPDVPPISVRVPGPEEMASDKVSAIFGREKPRDVHDLYILLRQGAKLEMDEVMRKVPGFTPEGLERRIKDRRREWRTLEPLLVTGLPPLDEEMDLIMRCVEGLYD